MRLLGGHYLLAALQVDEKDRTAFALEQIPGFFHYLCNQTLEIVLLFEDAARQVQQDLIALILQHAVLEELCILNTCCKTRENRENC